MDIAGLVEKYQVERTSCFHSGYTEMQLRSDYINPLLKNIGWDVDNLKRQSTYMRDVIQEEYLESRDELGGKPDYTMRVGGIRKFFVEVKKPSVDILHSAKAAFQTRSYGWSGGTGIAVLTNFEHLIIYDCRYLPNISQDERVARVKVFHHTEYSGAIEELKRLLSYDSSSNGILEELFSLQENKGEPFDKYFLRQIIGWRSELAMHAVIQNESLTDQDLNFLIQRLINRIVFLRICEDRQIEKFERLKAIRSYEELKLLFVESDKKFNSGLFNFIEDSLALTISLQAEVLIKIFSELYYPLSPFNFAVVDPFILSQIYEHFLASQIVVTGERIVSVIEHPEVAASNGVVPTPKAIVDKIIKDTLSPVIADKNWVALQQLKIADICCGSGTFLISSFEFIAEQALVSLLNAETRDTTLLDLSNESLPRLSLKAKRLIILQNLYGVDINPYATEVSEFSLMLKLLEGEHEQTVNHFLLTEGQRVLPELKSNIKCGNSLVDNRFFEFMPNALGDHLLFQKINPFDWNMEFPFLNHSKGFDAIVGNPPYVRIQNLVKYAPEEVKYYQSAVSGFQVAAKESIDKYYVFIQRAIQLLNPSGFLGYIVPHKFFILTAGKRLREFISRQIFLSKIVHFGVTQVFPGRSTYTAILILQKPETATVQFKKLSSVEPRLLFDEQGYSLYSVNDFKKDPWQFIPLPIKSVFDKVKSSKSVPLKKLTNIVVGLQTSDNDCYIFHPTHENDQFYFFQRDNREWKIEKLICVPAIHKQQLLAFGLVEANAQLIFPYSIVEGQAILLEEDSLRQNFPSCYEYLFFYMDDLMDRNIDKKKVKAHYEEAEDNGSTSSVKWYQFGRSQSLTKFHHTEKLVWWVLSRDARYAIDYNNVQFTGGGNGPYYGLINKSDYSLLYFLGILSHPVFERMVKYGASEFQGEYYSHGKQFIEHLPIIEIDPDNKEQVRLYNFIIQTVQQIINATSVLAAAQGKNQDIAARRLNLLKGGLIHSINDLYQISEEEYHTVIDDEI